MLRIRNFFIDLENILRQNNDIPCFIGEDWNCTYSSSPLESNIDCINMRRLPNIIHSRKIADLCTTFEMSDPYRFLYPEKRDYSYVPRVEGAKNKSRLDFFLVSDSLLGDISECIIQPNI
jgi:exonuclease III